MNEIFSLTVTVDVRLKWCFVLLELEQETYADEYHLVNSIFELSHKTKQITVIFRLYLKVTVIRFDNNFEMKSKYYRDLNLFSCYCS